MICYADRARALSQLVLGLQATMRDLCWIELKGIH